MNSTNKYSFFELLKRFGVSKLFLCTEAYLSLIIPLILFYLMFYINESSIKGIAIEFSKFLIALDIAMLAIVTSGFAIVLSVSGSDFLYFLNRKDLIVRFFFPFYLSSVLWEWHYIFSIGLFLLASVDLKSEIINNILIVILFIYISFLSMRL